MSTDSDSTINADQRPTEDALDKDQLDQLHAATLKASDACFELKKLCASVLVPTGSLVAFLSDRILNAAVFIAGFAVIVVFWLADTVAFYYQRKLRASMTEIWVRRAARCNNYTYIPKGRRINALRAFLHLSMSFYWVLLTLVVITFVLYGFEIIHPVAPAPRAPQ